MKPISIRFAGSSGKLFLAPFSLLKTARKNKWLSLLLLSLFISGCFQHYFRTGTSNRTDAATIQKLMNAQKYFVIRKGVNAYGLLNVSVKGDNLEGDLAVLPFNHDNYLYPDINKSNRVKKEDKPDALMEVHLYTSEAITEGQTRFSMPLSSINRIDVYEFDKNATRSNHILSAIGVSVVGASVIASIAVLIACNCPQVYVNNNGQYEFKSGMYSGAVYSSLERTDHLVLGVFQPVNNSLQLKIANVEGEEQFINKIALLRAEHPAGVNLLSDRNGNIFSIADPVSPAAAYFNNSSDANDLLRNKDGRSYSFDSEPAASGLSYINLSFVRPLEAKRGKLVINAGNSKWSGYLNSQFISLFGNSYNNWRRQQEEAGPARARQWLIGQGLPMKVYVETRNGWEYADYFELTGNTSSRDMVMEIGLENTLSDKVNIRIETVYRFWDLDLAAMDFSDQMTIRVERVEPLSAVTGLGIQVNTQLSEQDKEYTQLRGNDFIHLSFPVASPSAGLAQTFVLATGGYYHTLVNTGNKPDLQTLLKLKEAGSFDRFSRSKFGLVEDAVANARIRN